MQLLRRLRKLRLPGGRRGLLVRLRLRLWPSLRARPRESPRARLLRLPRLRLPRLLRLRLRLRLRLQRFLWRSCGLRVLLAKSLRAWMR